MKGAAIAEEVFAKNPLHPGAVHYLIHSYDDPVHAPLGMRAARVYAKIAPAAVHVSVIVAPVAGIGVPRGAPMSIARCFACRPRDARNESQARRNVGILFDDNRLNDETARLLRRSRASKPEIVPSSGPRPPTSAQQVTIFEKAPARYDTLFAAAGLALRARLAQRVDRRRAQGVVLDRAQRQAEWRMHDPPRQQKQDEQQAERVEETDLAEHVEREQAEDRLHLDALQPVGAAGDIGEALAERFHHVGVFPYYQEDGTDAAALEAGCGAWRRQPARKPLPNNSARG